ncbi:glycosyltransferase family 2 protein [Desulfococcaceae bacterium HSG8]|nr:glycosyltransferase family 2 protein [Desulfococcaceae bacterium HSG8]
MKLSVTIPIHNEQKNLELLYDNLIRALEPMGTDFEIILVNDGSDDDSGNILDTIANRDSRVSAIHLLRNYGQTSAMMAGFDHASGDIIIAMDGDNQNDPADIPRLLEKMNEGYDVVSGWRKDRQDARISRIIPSRIANWLISRVSGVKLHDYGCSLKAYKKEVIKGIRLYGEMHRFIPVFTAWRGAKVSEIVVNHRPRRLGISHYGLSRVFRVMLDLTLIRFLDKHLQNPIHFFGGLGLINFFLAVMTFLMMLYYKFWGGKSFTETPLPTLTVLFALMGGVAVLMGILAEIIMRTYYESQQKKPYRIDKIVKSQPPVETDN